MLGAAGAKIGVCDTPELHGRVFFGRVAVFVFRACREHRILANICSQLAFRACRNFGFSGVSAGHDFGENLFGYCFSGVSPFLYLGRVVPAYAYSGNSQETLRKLPANSQVHFPHRCERSPEFPNTPPPAFANSQMSERASVREFPNASSQNDGLMVCTGNTGLRPPEFPKDLHDGLPRVYPLTLLRVPKLVVFDRSLKERAYTRIPC